MREYIKPQTEVIPSMTYVMAGISGVHNEVGDDNEFTNTTEFEADLTQVEKKSLWGD